MATLAVLVLGCARDASAQHNTIAVSAVAGSVGSALLVQGVDEQGTGLWYGGRLDFRFGPVVGEASGLKGTLAPAAGTTGFESDGGEIRAVAGFQALPWLALEGSYDTRAFDSPAGYQKWTVTGAGAKLSSMLGTPSLHGYLRLHYLFGVSVTGQEKPDLAVAVEGGLDIAPPTSALRLGVFYRLERFDFPNGTRLEHFDMLGVRLGFAPLRAQR